jgi:peroxiredoxin
VTNDEIKTLERFTKRHKIAFPLLSDEGSKIITAFNLFNSSGQPGSYYYGTAVPQVVVVNPEGVVTLTFSGHGYTSDDEIEGIVERAVQGPAS